jgi:hypothetical protein
MAADPVRAFRGNFDVWLLAEQPSQAFARERFIVDSHDA